jgi:hypothetical protein
VRLTQRELWEPEELAVAVLEDKEMLITPLLELPTQAAGVVAVEEIHPLNKTGKQAALES